MDCTEAGARHRHCRGTHRKVDIPKWAAGKRELPALPTEQCSRGILSPTATPTGTETIPRSSCMPMRIGAVAGGPKWAPSAPCPLVHSRTATRSRRPPRRADRSPPPRPPTRQQRHRSCRQAIARAAVPRGTGALTACTAGVGSQLAPCSAYHGSRNQGTGPATHPTGCLVPTGTGAGIRTKLLQQQRALPSPPGLQPVLHRWQLLRQRQVHQAPMLPWSIPGSLMRERVSCSRRGVEALRRRRTAIFEPVRWMAARWECCRTPGASARGLQSSGLSAFTR